MQEQFGKIFPIHECLINIIFLAVLTILIACRFGLGLGFYLALTFANVLVSAVNTIIVCFAEAPQDLQRNHGALSRQMREAWNKVYPTVHVIY
jgi:hypothetical protein